VVGLDIDGTLGAYHEHFIAFAEGWLGKAIPRNYDGSVPLHKWCGISKQRYRECKMAYRRGGLKRSMPTLPAPYPDARRLTVWLNRLGCDVWLCTTRPYLSYDNIDDDTRHWLRRNGVAHAGVLWGEHKYRELARTVGVQRVAGVLEDDVAMCQQSRRLGMPTVWAVRPHNERECEWGLFTSWADYMAEIEGETEEVLGVLLRQWKEKAA
jgi:hypothetical protein